MGRKRMFRIHTSLVYVHTREGCANASDGLLEAQRMCIGIWEAVPDYS